MKLRMAASASGSSLPATFSRKACLLGMKWNATCGTMKEQMND
jgi:hypothetical protein